VEWARLEPVLEALLASKGTDRLFPQISVDTYHPATAQRALALGVDIINDVTGLTNPQMLDLAQGGGADWIAMHSLGIPADPERIFSPGTDPVAAVEQWLMERLDAWTRAGLDLNRIVFDPGIGFGKDALQSLKLLRAAGRFRQYGLRVLIGHSRKSFLRSITNPALAARDLATVGASLSLCQQRVDILRVHNVAVHTAAYRGWMHAQPVTGTGS
jgi:dihydropteroate synthase